MRRTCLTILTIGTLTLVGCGNATIDTLSSSGSNQNTPMTETTVTIDGSTYTCEQITSQTIDQCSALVQQAFDMYKENIMDFTLSGNLGALNDMEMFTNQNVAYAGLSACATVLGGDGQTEYLDFMMDEPAFGGKYQVGEVSFAPAWTAARDYLCPDLDFPEPSTRP